MRSPTFNQVGPTLSLDETFGLFGLRESCFNTVEETLDLLMSLWLPQDSKCVEIYSGHIIVLPYPVSSALRRPLKERDEIAIWIEHAKFARAPGLGLKRCIRMHDLLRLQLLMDFLNAFDFDSTAVRTCQKRFCP
jgi:hypothetical protein